MKKYLFYSLVFILAVFLMVNYSYCVLSGNTSSDELTDSEKSLIKKFGYGENYVKRWPDGIVYVYNGTTYKGLPKIIKIINQIIGGKTIFQLSKDKKISKVVFESYASNKYAAESKWSWKGYNLEKWVTLLSNKYVHDSKNNKFFLSKFTQIAGFNFKADEKKYGKWWEFSIDRNVKKMLKALYKVPPGYNLLTGEVE
ncbi:MAG: hypothetical protein U9R12_05250 [Candidatus Caldatribacteriota bacterium]|nr:hypothetical protein [Candidatus Caldatribacteriota bacterium]